MSGISSASLLAETEIAETPGTARTLCQDHSFLCHGDKLWWQEKSLACWGRRRHPGGVHGIVETHNSFPYYSLRTTYRSAEQQNDSTVLPWNGPVLGRSALHGAKGDLGARLKPVGRGVHGSAIAYRSFQVLGQTLFNDDIQRELAQRHSQQSLRRWSGPQSE